MRLTALTLGVTLVLMVAGCDRFGKHGALIGSDETPASVKSAVTVTTSEMVSTCSLLGEINSRAGDITKGKQTIRLMAADIGATHLVWTAAEKFDDAPPSQQAFVSGRAYRCK